MRSSKTRGGFQRGKRGWEGGQQEEKGSIVHVSGFGGGGGDPGGESKFTRGGGGDDWFEDGGRTVDGSKEMEATTGGERGAESKGGKGDARAQQEQESWRPRWQGSEMRRRRERTHQRVFCSKGMGLPIVISPISRRLGDRPFEDGTHGP
ncbi:hypothetical protein AMTR_s00058p00042080 [Amborella trichopoda]|uniref:Uncharacterized protein n=1 Tax=Amborella trichopoda TaxID=13333 RepID=W1PFR7_AMBTC|nr:hypothetical protein AMTR_s00058p00042080 [Amborella trichopoda]